MDNRDLQILSWRRFKRLDALRHVARNPGGRLRGTCSGPIAGKLVSLGLITAGSGEANTPLIDRPMWVTELGKRAFGIWSDRGPERTGRN